MPLFWQLLCQVKLPERAAFTNNISRLMPWWFISRGYSGKEGVFCIFVSGLLPQFVKVSEWYRIRCEITRFCFRFGPYMALWSWTRHLTAEGIELTGHYMVLSSRETSPNAQNECLCPHHTVLHVCASINNQWHYIEVINLQSCWP